MPSLLWYVTITELAIAISCEFLCLYFFGRIIYRQRSKKVSFTVELSPSMHFYFYTQVITSLTSLLFLWYYLIYYNFYHTYNSYVFFYIFAIQKITVTTLPFAALAVGLDRCFFIVSLIKYRKSLAPIWTSGIFAIAAVTYTVIHVVIPTYPSQIVDPQLRIDSSRVAAEAYLHVRFFSSCFILVTCVFLLIMFQKRANVFLGPNITGKSNKIILFTLILTLLFNFIPHFVNAVISATYNLNLTLYIGPWSTTIGSVESLLCGLLYRKIYKRKTFQFSGVVSVTPISPMVS